MQCRDTSSSIDYQKILIAHACGTFNGMVYVNSVEAFINSYEEGFRRFEVDLHMTKEGDLMSIHNISGYNFLPYNDFEKVNMQGVKALLGEIPFIANSKRFMPTNYGIKEEYKMRGLTPITPTWLAILCIKFSDIEFILDTKSTNPKIYMEQYKIIRDSFDKYGSDFNQIVPQFYNIDMAKKALREFDFTDSIYTLYLEPFITPIILKNIEETKEIRGITVSKRRLQRNPKFIEQVHDLGRKCNVHTLDRVEDIHEFVQRRIDGIYSHISPREMNEQRVK